MIAPLLNGDHLGTMMHRVSEVGAESGRYSVEQYAALAECGIISPDDRVELLDGLIVAMAPPSPPHDSTISRIQYALQRELGLDTLLRVQMGFLAGAHCLPEPDLAVVPGNVEDYTRRHPSRADLIVEVARTSPVQDRITKSAIYARAGVPCYWIVNLRDRCVEVFREPNPWKAEYASVVRATGGDPLVIDAYPASTFQDGELLPPSVPDSSRDDA